MWIHCLIHQSVTEFIWRIMNHFISDSVWLSSASSFNLHHWGSEAANSYLSKLVNFLLVYHLIVWKMTLNIHTCSPTHARTHTHTHTHTTPRMHTRTRKHTHTHTHAHTHTHMHTYTHTHTHTHNTTHARTRKHTHTHTILTFFTKVTMPGWAVYQGNIKGRKYLGLLCKCMSMQSLSNMINVKVPRYYHLIWSQYICTIYCTIF